MDVLIPLRTLGSRTPDPLQQRVATLAPLRKSISIDQLRTELGGTSQYLQCSAGNNNLELLATSLQESALEYMKPLFAVLAFGAAPILTISIGNATTLLLIKTISRRAELATHFALGTTPRDIVGLMFKEGVSLTLGTLLMAVAVGYATTRMLILMLPAGIPRVDQLAFDNTAVANCKSGHCHKNAR